MSIGYKNEPRVRSDISDDLTIDVKYVLLA